MSKRELRVRWPVAESHLARVRGTVGHDREPDTLRDRACVGNGALAFMQYGFVMFAR
ncbi:hypothetical protein GCM10010256_51300 [Streptomyces coeruleorubidus]|nr:hypothetical protein GCM10010256_51300 [Streptomyces coeruleorubidus]